MEAQIHTLYGLRTYAENINWVDGIYVYRENKRLQCSVHTSDYKMSLTQMYLDYFEKPILTYEETTIQKEEHFTQKEKDDLQRNGFTIEGKLATRSLP